MSKWVKFMLVTMPIDIAISIVSTHWFPAILNFSMAILAGVLAMYWQYLDNVEAERREASS